MFIEAGQDTPFDLDVDFGISSYREAEGIPKLHRIVDVSSALAPATSGAVVDYRWQRALDIVAILVFGRSTTVSNEIATAALSFTWEDDKDRQVGTSGLAPQSIPAFALASQREFFPLQFVSVKQNEVYRFQFVNGHATATITPILLFRCVDREG